MAIGQGRQYPEKGKQGLCGGTQRKKEHEEGRIIWEDLHVQQTGSFYLHGHTSRQPDVKAVIEPQNRLCWKGPPKGHAVHPLQCIGTPAAHQCSQPIQLPAGTGRRHLSG